MTACADPMPGERRGWSAAAEPRPRPPCGWRDGAAGAGGGVSRWPRANHGADAPPCNPPLGAPAARGYTTGRADGAAPGRAARATRRPVAVGTVGGRLAWPRGRPLALSWPLPPLTLPCDRPGTPSGVSTRDPTGAVDRCGRRVQATRSATPRLWRRARPPPAGRRPDERPSATGLDEGDEVVHSNLR